MTTTVPAERSFGPMHPSSQLGNLYQAQRRFDEARFRQQQALKLLESSRGKDDLSVANAGQPAARIFAHRERPPERRFRLAIPPLRHKQQRKTVERVEDH